MGLFDNPLGFLFGEEGEQGTIDRRVNREPEGQRWWENWEQTFGQGGPMDPMNVYPSARNALETLMRQYFPGWGNQMFTAPLGPGAGGGMDNIQQGKQANWQGRPAPAMPGLLDMEQGEGGVWGAGKPVNGGGFDPTGGARSATMQRFIDSPKVNAGQVPTYEFSPDELTAGAANQGRQNMMYKFKKPGEPGYDPVRDRVTQADTGGGFSTMPAGGVVMDQNSLGGPQNMMYRIKKPGEPGYDPVRDKVTDADMSGFRTMPVGEGVAMTPAPTNGGTTTPGLLEPLTLSIDGQRLPLVTKYDQTRNDLALQYVAALTGMMNPWLQGGMELERGRYGSPYQTQGSNGLVSDVLTSFAGGAGKGLGVGMGDYVGGKMFG